MELTGLLDRPVAVYRIYCQIAGSVDGGVFLAQAVFWSTSSGARARHGWWSHEARCIEAATGVHPNTQSTIRSYLRGRGILNERRTIGGRVAARVDLERLAECVRAAGAAGPEDDHASGCGCIDSGLAARAADVAAAKEKPESGNQDSRIREIVFPESEKSGIQNREKSDSLYPETTPETPSETTPAATAGPAAADNLNLAKEKEGCQEEDPSFLAILEELRAGKKIQNPGALIAKVRGNKRHVSPREARALINQAQAILAREKQSKASASAANERRLAEAERRSQAEADCRFGLLPHGGQP